MADTIPIQRILLLRPSALGDVCRTVPVLASLRAHWPEAAIHWVVQTTFCPAVEAHPALSGVIPFPREAFRGGWRRPRKWMDMRRWLSSLGRGQWDLAIDCQGLARTGLMLRASKAQIRVGDRAAREGAWMACNRRVRVPVGTHEVDRMLLLAQAAGSEPVADTALYVPADGAAWWAECRKALPEGPFAVLAVTSRWPSKAWPVSHWSDLAARIVKGGLAKWVALPGSRGESAAVAAAADAIRSRGIEVVDFSGRTDVGQLMALIEAAAFTVSNDSAALHMALGLGARCLGLYGPTDPAIVGPWNHAELAIRAPLNEGECPAYRDRRIGDSIMRRLGVDPVMERVEALAERWVR